MNRLILLFLSAISILTLNSCSDDDAVPDENTVERVILVWLAGDNNLAYEVPRKIEALAYGFSKAADTNSRLIIYSDYAGNYPRIVEISTRGEIKPLVTYPAQNSASPETLRRILTEMMEQAPARHYGLIVFSHATGWLPKGALEHPSDYTHLNAAPHSVISRTILDDNDEQMSFSDFANALPIPPDGKYDYIIFENCFTAGIETAYDFRDKARHLVVSAAEILSPGFEEIYRRSLHLIMQPTPDLTGFAREYYDYRNAMTDNHRSATISVLNTAGIDALASLVRDIETSTTPVDESILPEMQRFNRHKYTLFFDLEEYLTTRCAARAAEIHAAIADIVEYAAATPAFIPGYNNGFTINRHCGITTYIPQTSFPDLNAAYALTPWRLALR